MNKLFLNKDTNLIDYSTWITGTTGSTNGTGPSPSFWNQYSLNNTLNERVLETDPWGIQSVCWRALSGNTQSGNVYGGFNITAAANSYQLVPVDKTKTYRFSCWIKRKNVVAGQGYVYFGLWAMSGITSRNSIIATPTYSTTNNPYPILTSPTQTNVIFPENEWRLCVAHLRPYTTPTGTTLHTNTGVYQPNGTKLTTGMTIRDYIMISDTYNVGIRASTPFNVPSGTSVSGCFLYPRIDLVDGTEPSIAQLLKAEKDNKLVSYEQNTNMLDLSSWIDGTTGSTAADLTTSFTQYTSNSTNYRFLGTDPFNNNSIIWEGFGNTSDATAGFQSTGPAEGILIDNTKTYRFSIWNRLVLTGQSIANRYYFGYNPRKGVSADFSFHTNLSTTGISNSYYFLPALSPVETYFQLNEWKLCVGYLLPSTTSPFSFNSSLVPKIYNLTGGTDYTSIYNYYSSGSTTGVYMRVMMPYQSTLHMQAVYPRIDLVDGTEPSIEELLNNIKRYNIVMDNISYTTTTTTTVLSCYSQTLYYSTVETLACESNIPNSMSTDTATFATATKLYVGAGCNTVADVGYWSNKSMERYWNGSTLSAATECEPE